MAAEAVLAESLQGRLAAAVAVGESLQGRLAAAVDALVAVAVDGMDELAIHAELGGSERQIRRLQARNMDLAAALALRQVARQQAAHPHDVRAGQRAAVEVGQSLTEELGWSPSQATQVLRTGCELQTLPATREAFQHGQLSPAHAKVIADTLRHLTGEQRRQAEQLLVEAAQGQDPVALGRTARRLLAEVDHDAAVGDEDRRHTRRCARLTHTDDGMLVLHAALAGIDAETAATAIDAFRTPDSPGEAPRRPEQRTADALVAALRVALDAGQAPTRHGERPHISVLVNWSDLVAGQGAAEAAWSGPLPVGVIRPLLEDAAISRVVTAPDSLPLDVGRATRSVPAGVWRALVARDGGCTFPGCRRPPGWCDAAHLKVRWWQGGHMRLHDVALLCRPHHRRVDRGEWTGTIQNGKVVWNPPQPHTPDRPDPP